jgi:hypothetical protein
VVVSLPSFAVSVTDCSNIVVNPRVEMVAQDRSGSLIKFHLIGARHPGALKTKIETGDAGK